MSEGQERLDILYVGMLPPHPGGSAVSGAQLVVGFARQGHRVRCLAPVTAEGAAPGDAFAAAHPEIGVTRWLIPHFNTTPHLPAPDEQQRQEGEQIRARLASLIEHDRQALIFIGRHLFTPYILDVVRARLIPCILRESGGPAFGLLSGKYPPALAQLLFDAYRQLDLVITPARYMAEALGQAGVSGVKSIRNAVDLEQFAPRPKDVGLLGELSVGGADVVVVHVSNLNPRKRPLDVAHSAERALRQNPRLLYVIVGDGLLRTALEDACRQAGILHRFRFTGWVDYRRMPAFVNLADLVVMTSEGEGLARVYLEAQACARVLVASDIPAAREVISHGTTGLLFRTGDVDDLAAKTLLAAGDPVLRAAIGVRAREAVRAHGLDEAVASYLATFREVVRQAGS